MQEMDLLGVRVEMPANAPMVLLRERDGGNHARTVPIFIGAPEATATALNSHVGQHVGVPVDFSPL